MGKTTTHTLFVTLLLSILLNSSSFSPFVFVGRSCGFRLCAKGGGDGKDYGVIDVSERPPNPLTPCTQTEIASQRVALQTLETKYSKITSSKKYDASRILGFTEKEEEGEGGGAVEATIVCPAVLIRPREGNTVAV